MARHLYLCIHNDEIGPTCQIVTSNLPNLDHSLVRTIAATIYANDVAMTNAEALEAYQRKIADLGDGTVYQVDLSEVVFWPPDQIQPLVIERNGAEPGQVEDILQEQQ